LEYEYDTSTKDQIHVYVPLELVKKLIRLSRKPMKVDDEKLIFKQSESLIVERLFLAEALK